MGAVLAERLFIKPEQDDLRQTFIERWAENDQAAYLAVMRGLAAWDVEDRVAEIAVPALLIASDQDYTALELKQALVARMPHAQLKVIQDARHAVTVECPQEFNAVLGEFLKSVRQT